MLAMPCNGIHYMTRNFAEDVRDGRNVLERIETYFSEHWNLHLLAFSGYFCTHCITAMRIDTNSHYKGDIWCATCEVLDAATRLYLTGISSLKSSGGSFITFTISSFRYCFVGKTCRNPMELDLDERAESRAFKSCVAWTIMEVCIFSG